MNQGIGWAGRQARRLALDHKTKRIGHAVRLEAWPNQPSPLPLVQRTQAESTGAATAPAGADEPTPGSDRTPAADERERRPPSPEEIAERVYELLRQDVRQGRER